jgi:hypothetical protein
MRAKVRCVEKIVQGRGGPYGAREHRSRFSPDVPFDFALSKITEEQPQILRLRPAAAAAAFAQNDNAPGIFMSFPQPQRTMETQGPSGANVVSFLQEDGGFSSDSGMDEVRFAIRDIHAIAVARPSSERKAEVPA